MTGRSVAPLVAALSLADRLWSSPFGHSDSLTRCPLFAPNQPTRSYHNGFRQPAAIDPERDFAWHQSARRCAQLH
jgi:hypothetical protein